MKKYYNPHNIDSVKLRKKLENMRKYKSQKIKCSEWDNNELKTVLFLPWRAEAGALTMIGIVGTACILGKNRSGTSWCIRDVSWSFWSSTTGVQGLQLDRFHDIIAHICVVEFPILCKKRVKIINLKIESFSCTIKIFYLRFEVHVTFNFLPV